jgi:hypothetical protein
MPEDERDPPFSRAYEARIDDVSKPRRTVAAKINTGIVDRYRTVVLPSGGDFRNFMMAPAVLWEHGQCPTRGRLPIGHCTSIKFRKGEDDILAVTRFKDDEYSSMILDDFASGTLSAFSVDFLPDLAESSRATPDELRKNPAWAEAQTIYRKWELTGYSAVSYPGNPEALATAVARGLWVPDDVRATLPDPAGDPPPGPPPPPPELPPVRSYTLEELSAACLRSLLLPMLVRYDEIISSADDLARGRV